MLISSCGTSKSALSSRGSRHDPRVIYANCSYLELDSLSKVAAGGQDSTLAYTFRQMMDEIADSTYASVDRMSIPDAVSFYKSHQDLLPFLDSYYEEMFVDGLDEQSYSYVRYLNELFQGTNLEGSVNDVFSSLSEEIRNSILSDCEAYFALEDEVLSGMKAYFDGATSSYVGSGAQKISDALLDEFYSDFLSKIEDHISSLMPEPKMNENRKVVKAIKNAVSMKDKALDWVMSKADVLYEKIDRMESKVHKTTDDNFLKVYTTPLEKNAVNKFTSFADSLYKYNLSFGALESEAGDILKAFCEESKNRRAELVYNYLPDIILPDSLFVSVTQHDFPEHERDEECYSILQSLARIKSRTNNYDAASFVSSFAIDAILGPFAAIYDACDLAAGMYVVKKSGELAQSDIERFNKKLIASAMKQFMDFSDQLFSKFEDEVKASQNAFIEYVNENI